MFRTAKERNHKYIVVAVIDANENDNVLYAVWYWLGFGPLGLVHHLLGLDLRHKGFDGLVHHLLGTWLVLVHAN